MSSKQIEPLLGAESFSCPHCGAIAHQTWYKALLITYERNKKPAVVQYDAVLDTRTRAVVMEETNKERERQRVIAYYDRLHRHVVTYRIMSQSGNSSAELVNVSLSQCFSCDGFSIWVKDKLMYPATETAFIAHEEMPEAVKDDFNEAASIVDKSARGAAALLRLAIQKIVIELGEKGDNLNHDIGKLVEKGKITSAIQQALDVVRVVGNNAVHPGTIDLNDDKSVATNLFGLVNVIVEAAIATPKHIKAMYETVVPESARDAIEKRDNSKT